MRVNLHIGPTPVGVLSEIAGETYFQYDDQFVASDVQLSPLHLPLERDVFRCDKAHLLRLPGMCYDSLPDAWGHRIMERWFQTEEKRGLDSVSPLEQLCFVGDRGVGALRYEPALLPEDPLRPEIEAALDLRRAELDARTLLTGSPADAIPGLLQLARNGSAGGARPKLWIGLQKNRGALRLAAGGASTPPGFTPWLLKLDVPAVNAPYREYGRIEHAYALMAAAAGLRSCSTQLIESPDDAGQTRAHFAIARFDRGTGNRRIHFHSLAGITESDFNSALDYRELLSTTLNVCRDWQEGLEALRRVIFNVAARVRDDHAKNHGFLLDPAVGWRLSPAYDLIYASPARFPRHAMSVAGNAFDPGVPELLRLADEAEIPRHEARGAIESAKAAIAQWSKFAEQAGLSKARAGEIGANLPGVTW